jgi:hypothetical protein
MNLKGSAVFSIVAIFAAAVLFVPIVADHQAFAFSGTGPACLATSSCGVYYGPCVQEHAQFSYAWCAKIFPH